MDTYHEKRQSPKRRKEDVLPHHIKELVEAAKEVLDRQGLNWFGLQRLRIALDIIEKGEKI